MKVMSAGKFLILILLLNLLNGCTKTIKIKILDNGQAEVDYTMRYEKFLLKDTSYSKAEIKKMNDSLISYYNGKFNNSLISDYTCKANRHCEPSIHYNIVNIDSLYKFLCVECDSASEPVYFIKYEPGRLTIDAGKGDTLHEGDDISIVQAMKFNLTLELPRKIKKLNNESGIRVKVSGKRIYIKSSDGDVRNSGKRNLILIDF